MTLSNSQRDVLENRKANNQISVYGFGNVSAEVFAECVSDIKKAFPKLSKEWYDVLEKMIDEEGFTNERLKDATKAMIRTCEYPEPTIAKIIGFDKIIKVYSYNELLELKKDASPTERKEHLESFGRIDFYGQLRFAKNDDILKYNLQKWNKKGVTT